MNFDLSQFTKWVTHGTKMETESKYELKINYLSNSFYVSTHTTRAAILKNIQTKLGIREIHSIYFQFEKFEESCIHLRLCQSVYVLMCASSFSNGNETNFIFKKNLQDVENYFYNFYENHQLHQENYKEIHDQFVQTHDSIPLSYVLLQVKNDNIQMIHEFNIEENYTSFTSGIEAAAAAEGASTHMEVDESDSSVST